MAPPGNRWAARFACHLSLLGTWCSAITISPPSSLAPRPVVAQKSAPNLTPVAPAAPGAPNLTKAGATASSLAPRPVVANVSAPNLTHVAPASPGAPNLTKVGATAASSAPPPGLEPGAEYVVADQKTKHLQDAEAANDSLSEVAFDVANPSFGDIDSNNDNKITVNEAATFAVRNGVPWGEIKPIFDTVDTNHDNVITKEEFLANYKQAVDVFQDLRASFRDIDINQDGFISSDEWMAYCDGWMVSNISKETCANMFEAADNNEPKGAIDREEYNSAGSRCKSIDDGNCAGFLSLTRSTSARFLGSGSSKVVSRKPTVSAPKLFGDAVRQHRQKRVGSP